MTTPSQSSLPTADDVRGIIPPTAGPSGDVEQRAREMIAAEYERLNYPVIAKSVREQERPKIDFPFALRAITKALQSTDEVVEVLRACQRIGIFRGTRVTLEFATDVEGFAAFNAIRAYAGIPGGHTK